MLQRRRKLANITAVAAGAQVTVNCPVGETYHQINLDYAGVTLAQLKSIKVMINGRAVQEFADGAELDAINKYYARQAAAGILTIHLRRPEFENTAFDRLFAIGTSDVDTLQVQFDIDAGAAAPAITAWAVVATERQNLGLITKVRRYPKNFGAGGQVEIDSIIRGPRVLAMHLKKSDVNSVLLKLDDVEVFEDLSKARLEWEQKHYGRVPQTAAYTHLDFVLEGNIDSMLVTGGLQSMRLLPTLGAAGDLVPIVEYADLFNGI